MARRRWRFFDPDDTIVGDEFTGGISTQDNFINLEQGYIELGGFRVGKAATLFETGTFAAGNVVNDDLVDYGTFKTLQIAYTFTGANGFAASLALEEGGPAATLVSIAMGMALPIRRGRPLHARQLRSERRWPASFTQGWGGVSAVVGYDAVWEEWAGKVRVDLNATDALTFFVMAGYKSGANESDLDGFDTPNNYGRWGGDWAIWGGGSWQATEKAQFNTQLSYANGNDAQGDQYAVVLNVDYELVENSGSSRKSRTPRQRTSSTMRTAKTIRRLAAYPPLVLIGCKADLKNPAGNRRVFSVGEYDGAS